MHLANQSLGLSPCSFIGSLTLYWQLHQLIQIKEWSFVILLWWAYGENKISIYGQKSKGVLNSSSLSLHIKMGWLWSADPIRFKGTKLTNL